MDPFQLLPWLVLRGVLSDLPDLQSLYSIRLASPAVAAFLRQDGNSFTTIVESITSYNGDASGMFPENQGRIRNLALWWWWIRSKNSHLHVQPEPGDNPAPQTSDGVFRFIFSNTPTIYEQTHSNGPQYVRIQPHFDVIYGEIPLPLSTPPIILFRLLAFSNRLRQIVHVCFHDLIDCCMDLKPEHLEDPFIKFRNTTRNGLVTDRSVRPPGLPYLPVDIGPPTWREEQIIMGGVLAAILFIELRNALCSRDDLGVGEEARRFVCDGIITDVWNKAAESCVSINRNEMTRSVFSWLEGRSKEVASLRSWLTSSPIPASFLYCCREYTESKLPAPSEYEDKDISDSLYDSVGCQHMRYCRLTHLSPLRCVDVSVFRSFGFAIWEAERLHALGFLPKAEPGRSSIDKIWFAWSSILTEDQWDRLVQVQRETPYEE